MFRICLHLIIFVSDFKPLFYKNIIQMLSDVRSRPNVRCSVKLWKNSSCLRHSHRISTIIAHSFKGSNEINSKCIFKSKNFSSIQKVIRLYDLLFIAFRSFVRLFVCNRMSRISLTFCTNQFKVSIFVLRNWWIVVNKPKFSRNCSLLVIGKE